MWKQNDEENNKKTKTNKHGIYLSCHGPQLVVSDPHGMVYISLIFMSRLITSCLDMTHEVFQFIGIYAWSFNEMSCSIIKLYHSSKK
jgi:hypothetical protein